MPTSTFTFELKGVQGLQLNQCNAFDPITNAKLVVDEQMNNNPNGNGMIGTFGPWDHVGDTVQAEISVKCNPKQQVQCTITRTTDSTNPKSVTKTVIANEKGELTTGFLTV